MAKLARVVGVRRRVVVDGARFTERGSRRDATTGERVVVWEARFPSAEPMLIHPTAARVYPDLVPGAASPVHRLVRSRVRPGTRVLDAACGTGAGTAILMACVGPSGAVVALGDDEESVEFAQRRYPGEHVAFELGGLDTLRGEVEGAFDAVVAPRPVLSGRDDEATLRELWRVVGPGGILLVELATGPRPSIETEALVAEVCGVPIDVASGPGDGRAALVLTRPQASPVEDDEDDEDPGRGDEWRTRG